MNHHRKVIFYFIRIGYTEDMYKHIFKPILFLFSPDGVHRCIVWCGKLVQVMPPARWLLRRLWQVEDPVLAQTIDGVKFNNPVGLSAGFDKNVQLTPLMESVGFGFATGGSVTYEPRMGNPRPWFHRLPKTKSVVVFAGMPNHGLTRIRQYIQRNRRRRVAMPAVVSVAVIADKTTRERFTDGVPEEAIINDVKKATEYILQHKLAEVIELNISCPNAGKEPFIEPGPLEELLTVLDTVPRQVPFWVKMPHLYDMGQFDVLLDVIARHNIQGVTVANLVKERDRVALHDPLTDDIRGGLSGAPTQQQSIALIRRAYERHGDRLTIIGVGGVFSADDAYAKVRAGASLVGLITGMLFEGPGLIARINRELIVLLQRDGFTQLSEAVGADCRKKPKKSKNL